MSIDTFEFNNDRRPTLGTLHHIADRDSFGERWNSERLKKGLGRMAAATLEVSSTPIENPAEYFDHVAETVEEFEDGAVVFLKEPIGQLGFLALINNYDTDGRSPMVYDQGRFGISAGYVANQFDVDAPKLLTRGGWESYNRTAFVGMFDRRVKARHYGAKVVRPSREYGRNVIGYDGEPIIYSEIPVLSTQAAIQRKFVNAVEDNMKERSSGDEIKLLTDSIAYATPVDGALLGESDLLFAHDLARAIDQVNKVEHFSGEHRSKGQFAALLHWFAYQETKDLAFSEHVKDLIPYKTGNDILWDRARYSEPQPALVMSSVREDLILIAKGIAKVDGFGPKARKAIEGMLESYDARQTKQSVSLEALNDPQEPTVERLGFHDREDARELGALLTDLSARFDGRPVTKERIEEIVNSPDRELIIARIEGKIVATATVNVIVGLGAGRSAYLNDFVTSAESRGKGLGALMWAEIIQWCKDHKADYLEFTSSDKHEDAHAFYEKRGAVKRDTNVFRVSLAEADSLEA